VGRRKRREADVLLSRGVRGVVLAGRVRVVGRWWSPGVRLQYSVLAIAAIALAAQLAGWRLIGWGMS
jgi:hypothetical protein